jgi:hypothetical protein
MKDFKGMKRQRGRNRNTSGGSSGGNKPQQHNANRAFDSNGPEGIKVRGNAQHVFEKYQQLARDAGTSGDRVLAENYLQHAEHYFRVIRAVTPTRAVSDIVGRDAFVSGNDIDFEDESGAQAYVEPEPEVQVQQQNDQPRQDGYRQDNGNGNGGQQRQDNNSNYRQERQENFRQDGPRNDYNNNNNGQNRQRDDRNRGYDNNRPRDDRPRDDRPRDDRPRDDRPRDDRPRDDRPRDDRPRDDRPRDDRPRDDRPREDRARDDRPRDDRPRDDRPREDRPRDRDRNRDRPREDRADPMAVVEPTAAPLAAAYRDEAPQQVLRSADGDASHAPAFLKAREPRAPRATPRVAAVEEAPAADVKPKRKRAVKAETES